jgi:hypothetical protein
LAEMADKGSGVVMATKGLNKSELCRSFAKSSAGTIGALHCHL